jgi:hypothetical protein
LSGLLRTVGNTFIAGADAIKEAMSLPKLMERGIVLQ